MYFVRSKVIKLVGDQKKLRIQSNLAITNSAITNTKTQVPFLTYSKKYANFLVKWNQVMANPGYNKQILPVPSCSL